MTDLRGLLWVLVLPAIADQSFAKYCIGAWKLDRFSPGLRQSAGFHDMLKKPELQTYPCSSYSFYFEVNSSGLSILTDSLRSPTKSSQIPPRCRCYVSSNASVNAEPTNPALLPCYTIHPSSAGYVATQAAPYINSQSTIHIDVLLAPGILSNTPTKSPTWKTNIKARKTSKCHLPIGRLNILHSPRMLPIMARHQLCDVRKEREWSW